MGATSVSLIAFAAMFGGAVLGMGMRVLLPPHHLSSSSRDVIRLCIAILATVSSLVIGLLIASAKTSFDERTSSLRHFVAQAVLVDRAMSRLEPEIAPTRKLFRDVVENRLNEVRTIDTLPAGTLPPATPGATLDAVETLLLAFPADTDAQKSPVTGRSRCSATSPRRDGSWSSRREPASSHPSSSLSSPGLRSSLPASACFRRAMRRSSSSWAYRQPRSRARFSSFSRWTCLMTG